MKTTLITLLIALCCGSVLAQTGSGTPMKRISWSTDQACMKANFSDAETRDIPVTCDSFIKDGAAVKIIKADDLVLAVTIGDDGSYLIADTSVINNSNNRILVDPTHTSMFFWKDGDTKKAPERVGSIPGEKIASKIRTRIAWANALGAMGASMQNQTTTVNSTTNGTVSARGNDGSSANGTYSADTQSTITTKDTQAQVQEAMRARERNQKADATGASYISNGLKANTLFPKTSINGYIYFSRKKAEFAILTLELEGFLFDFPFKNPK